MTKRRTKTTTKIYECLEDVTLDLLSILRPPERLTVSQTAERYRKLNNKGAYIGPWRNAAVPYMVEPMDELSSRFFDGMAFVGPAQCGKTDGLLLNWVVHSVKTDPMDLILYSPTSGAARDFSLRRIDRLNQDSPAVGELLKNDRTADNQRDKHYVTGTMLSLSHPSKTEFAGKPVPRVGLTDYDRFDDDIDGDGNGYDLASKRTTTFGTFAMCLAESSPSKPIENPKWIAKTPHEAPPAKGIFSLYNRGDRRRWYWPCPHCGEYFEGNFDLLHWDRSKLTDIEQAESVYMACPKNGCVIDPDDRYEMNLWGTWLKDGEAFDKQGRKFGQGARTKMASFWLKGVAAAFVTWPKLVSTYIAADREYEITGSEESLKKFYNNDLAEVFLPKSADTIRLPEHLKSRADQQDDVMVPEGVRILIACIDVQKNKFVVQIHGIAPGSPCDVVIVDRFDVRKSKREDGNGGYWPVKPSAYLEDWDELIEHVMNRTYPLSDKSGRRMMIKLTVCDSGGYARDKGESVTSQAYAFYRRLRNDNLHGRFHLVKGNPSARQENVRARITFPDAQQKDKWSAAKGDVPVLLLNSNMLKDALSGRLDSLMPGKGMFRWPSWLPDWWYQEMCSEIRTEKGWENPSHSRNEAWDLCYYVLGVIASPILRLEHIDWLNPPSWAKEWDANDMVFHEKEDLKFATVSDKSYDLTKLAQLLG